MTKTQRVKVIARGAVQGVGFRPFVYRLATELALNGWVSNSAAGVFIEAEGTGESLRSFLARLQKEKPPRAMLHSFESSFLDAIGHSGFEIRKSETRGEKTTLILPDIATCADCLREIFDPADRRFGYPFTNCTNCGPRFSIIEALPYDRANTSMKKFAMCTECNREYHDPRDRRFHAQPNACPKCGPQLQFWNENGAVICERDEALLAAVELIRAGEILALKGLGGFQLMVDARDEDAVLRLRQRKHREEKPFALMLPSLEAAHAQCEVSELEERLLLSPESPIVLLRRRNSEIAPVVAPRNPNIGVLLPYSPVHHLLMRDLNFPVVATSGNLSDEPICTDEREALERLRGIADSFLVHDRAIVRHVDDSIARIMCGREMVLRRARGFAPLPVTVRSPVPTTLALGAHLKNTVALGIGANVFVSQHIGDLATAQAHEAFRTSASDLPRLYQVKAETIACDLHPDYLSTKYAAQHSQAPIKLQHHFAHIAACMAENELEPPTLGVAWDGTGLGTDGTIWGGEFLLAADGDFKRVAHLRTFPLPGGDNAIKEPRRVALGLLYELLADHVWDNEVATSMFSRAEIAILRSMLEKNINTPVTSSAGRLFDAVAALLRLRDRVSFEGQAAMELEFAIRAGVSKAYPCEMRGSSPIVIDWAPMISAIIDDLRRNQSAGVIAAKFHNGLVELIFSIAKRIGERRVVLSGGCFQNAYLTTRIIERLQEQDFQPYWHQRIPPNDGGISLGQVVAANWRSARGKYAHAEFTTAED